MKSGFFQAVDKFYTTVANLGLEQQDGIFVDPITNQTTFVPEGTILLWDIPKHGSIKF